MAMRKLWGEMQGDFGTVKQAGANDGIEMWCQTKDGRVTVMMTSDGGYVVTVAPVSGSKCRAIGTSALLARGDVSTGEHTEVMSEAMQSERDNDTDSKYAEVHAYEDADERAERFDYSSAYDSEADDAE